jgi:beta-galactosidase GanA
MQAALSAAEVTPAPEVPAGVEVVRRTIPRSAIVFLLNHRHGSVDVPVAKAGTNLIDGSEVHAGLLRLGPNGAAAIREGW